MSAHTPGPWAVVNPKERYASRSLVTASDGCVLIYDAPRTTETEANARLIAASPDLLAAWVEFLSAQKTIDGAGFMDNYTDAARARARQAHAIDKARAAIAKAEGRS